jgi:hypothetical protein
MCSVFAPAAQRLPDRLPDPVEAAGTGRYRSGQRPARIPCGTRRNGTRRHRPERGSSLITRRSQVHILPPPPTNTQVRPGAQAPGLPRHRRVRPGASPPGVAGPPARIMRFAPRVGGAWCSSGCGRGPRPSGRLGDAPALGPPRSPRSGRWRPPGPWGSAGARPAKPWSPDIARRRRGQPRAEGVRRRASWTAGRSAGVRCS